MPHLFELRNGQHVTLVIDHLVISGVVISDEVVTLIAMAYYKRPDHQGPMYRGFRLVSGDIPADVLENGTLWLPNAGGEELEAAPDENEEVIWPDDLGAVGAAG